MSIGWPSVSKVSAKHWLTCESVDAGPHIGQYSVDMTADYQSTYQQIVLTDT